MKWTFLVTVASNFAEDARKFRAESCVNSPKQLNSAFTRDTLVSITNGDFSSITQLLQDGTENFADYCGSRLIYFWPGIVSISLLVFCLIYCPLSHCFFRKCCVKNHKKSRDWSVKKKVLYMVVFGLLVFGMLISGCIALFSDSLFQDGSHYTLCQTYSMLDVTFNGDPIPVTPAPSATQAPSAAAGRQLQAQQFQPWPINPTGPTNPAVPPGPTNAADPTNPTNAADPPSQTNQTNRFIGLDRAENIISTMVKDLQPGSPFTQEVVRVLNSRLNTMVNPVEQLQTTAQLILFLENIRYYMMLQKSGMKLPDIFSLRSGFFGRHLQTGTEPPLTHTSALSQALADQGPIFAEFMTKQYAILTRQTYLEMANFANIGFLTSMSRSMSSTLVPLNSFKNMLTDKMRVTVDAKDTISSSMDAVSVIVIVLTVILMILVLVSFVFVSTGMRKDLSIRQPIWPSLMSWFSILTFAIITGIFAGFLSLVAVPSSEICLYLDDTITPEGLAREQKVIFGADAAGVALAEACLVRNAKGNLYNTLDIDKDLNVVNLGLLKQNEQTMDDARATKFPPMSEQWDYLTFMGLKKEAGLFTWNPVVFNEFAARHSFMSPQLRNALAVSTLYTTKEIDGYLSLNQLQTVFPKVGGSMIYFKGKDWETAHFPPSIDILSLGPATYTDPELNAIVDFGRAIINFRDNQVLPCNGELYSFDQWEYCVGQLFDSLESQAKTVDDMFSSQNAFNIQPETNALFGISNRYLTKPAGEIQTGLECGHMGDRFWDTFDGFCFSTVPGLWGIAVAWVVMFVLAVAAAIMAYMLYCKLLIVRKRGPVLDYSPEPSLDGSPKYRSPPPEQQTPPLTEDPTPPRRVSRVQPPIVSDSSEEDLFASKEDEPEPAKKYIYKDPSDDEESSDYDY